MLYFNGFSLHNEEDLFSEYLVESEFCVAGFSYGAQKAFEYVYENPKRVDRLILLSPAFFQTQKSAFIRTQLHYFGLDREAYVSQFLKNVTCPSKKDLSSYLNIGTKEELSELLEYQWEAEKIQNVLERGTVIEVFLGAKDKIIDSKEAYTFFRELTTCYYLKEAGHLLIR